MCPFSVERSYEGTGAAFDCVNPRFFDAPRATRAATARSTCATRQSRRSSPASFRNRLAMLDLSLCRGRGRRGPGPRAAPAVLRTAARPGTRGCRRRRARPRRGSRDGRGSSRAASSSRSGAGGAAARAPTSRSNSSITALERLGVADLVAGRSRWHESRQTPSRSPPPDSLDQLRELLEAAADRAARRRRCSRAAAGSAPVAASASLNAPAITLERRPAPALAAAGVHDHAAGPDRVADRQRMGERLERLAAHLRRRRSRR